MVGAISLYDRDFVLWTEEQAAALRRAKGSNLPLDWENLAEEMVSRPVHLSVSARLRGAGACAES